MGVKVSVIIPVYNSEKYLAETIESLLNQTLKECEFIFINDGSKDNSLNILEKYKEKDSRIIVINQENKGVSEARNRGLEIAKGEYIGFVDSDDYIKSDMYEKLYLISKENSCDIVVSNYINECNGVKSISKFKFNQDEILDRTYIEQNILPFFLYSDNFNAIWNKLFSHKIIRHNNIRFQPELSLGEDRIFNMKNFTYANRVYYSSYSGYFYRYVESSATHSKSLKDYFERELDVYKNTLKEVTLWNIDKEDEQRYKSIKLVNNTINLIHMYIYDNNKVFYNYQSIKEIINEKSFKEALDLCFKDKYKESGNYERLILKLIKKRLVYGVILVIKYIELKSKYRKHYLNKRR